jgi:hypothetical protein
MNGKHDLCMAVCLRKVLFFPTRNYESYKQFCEIWNVAMRNWGQKLMKYGSPLRWCKNVEIGTWERETRNPESYISKYEIWNVAMRIWGRETMDHESIITMRWYKNAAIGFSKEILKHGIMNRRRSLRCSNRVWERETRDHEWYKH